MTVQNYLYIMQKSFLIAPIPPFHRNIRKELTKMKKIYFLDVGFRNHLLQDFEPLSSRTDAGMIYENVVFNHLCTHHSMNKIKYWRTQTKHEIDFIVDEMIAVDVKYNAAQFRVPKYREFLQNYKIPLYVIYRRGTPRELKQYGDRIFFVSSEGKPL